MDFISKEPLIFILSGKAKSGKNLIADMIEEHYNDKKCIQLSFAYYLKQYAKKISNWDGLEETKPRKLLQDLGISLIKERIDSKLLIRRMIEDIKVYSYFYDIIVITDARLIDEIEDIKNNFNKSISIRINRNSYENNLTIDEKKHITEIGLDNYNSFDYILNNDDNLKNNLKNILKEIL